MPSQLSQWGNAKLLKAGRVMVVLLLPPKYRSASGGRSQRVKGGERDTAFCVRSVEAPGADPEGIA